MSRAPGIVRLGLVVVAACVGGEPARPRGGAGEGLAIVIHGPEARGGQVDERRWRQVPAHGELELGQVTSGLELDSVVVESVSDPDGLTTRSCHLVGAAVGLREPEWLWGRVVVVTLVDGTRVAGTVIDVGPPMAVIEHGVAQSAVPIATVRVDLVQPPAHVGVPRLGDDVYAIDDGREVFGRFVAIQPHHLVLRSTGGTVRTVTSDAVARLSVAGVPAEPTLRCDVASRRPGRHLVRVTYATGGVGWRADHRIASMPRGGEPGAVDDVVMTSSYVIAVDGWPGASSASVRLVLGLPDEPEPPVTVWEGQAAIGGGAVQVTGAPSRRRARLERVFRGADGSATENRRDPAWHEASQAAVWRELAFERLASDAPGPVRVAVGLDGGGVRWVDGEIGPSGPDGSSRVVRVVVAPEPDLVGFRRKQGRDLVGQALEDQVTFSVANRGLTPRRVVIEEELRGVVRPTVVYERVGDADGGGELLRDRWRTTVTVPAEGIVQGQLVLQYRFKRY